MGYTEKENFIVSSFEIAPTNDLKERKLFLGMKHTNVTFVNIVSDTYNLRLLLPAQLFIDVGERLRNNDQFAIGDIHIETVKVLSNYTSEALDPKESSRFHYRLLVVLEDMPSFEFLIDCPLLVDNNGTTF